MSKIVINMLSSATKVEGQGVGSAFLEQVDLIKTECKDDFKVVINSNEKADIIHHHTIDLTNYFKMCYDKSPSVAYVHFLPHTLDGSIKLPKSFSSIFKKYLVDFYKKANHLVVVNPIFINDLKKLGIKEENISYIPNYVSKDNFFIQKSKIIEETRQKYGIKKDEFVVLGVGQVQTRKGVKDFVEVALQNKDITFVWAGGFSFGNITDGYKELKAIVDDPPSNVKFLGIISRDEMNSVYNIADVLFMPSYNELFPMSILEAINTHKPLLLRDLDLYEDILFKKYKVGSNNDEFTKELRNLKDDNKEYQKYALYSKEISEFYSKENIGKIWKDFYKMIYEKYNKK